MGLSPVKLQSLCSPHPSCWSDVYPKLTCSQKPLSPGASSIPDEQLGKAMAGSDTLSECLCRWGMGTELVFPTWLSPVSDSSIYRELYEPLRKAPVVRGDTPEITLEASPFPWVNPDQTDLTWLLASQGLELPRLCLSRLLCHPGAPAAIRPSCSARATARKQAVTLPALWWVHIT